MREEVSLWLEQGEADLIAAAKNLEIEQYYLVAFLCQQAAEKSLKALFIHKKSRSAGQTHSLIFLAKEVKIPKEYYELLQNLTPEFITTRYPDVAGEVPYKLYGKDKVKEYLKGTKQLLKWIKSQIKKQ